MRINRFKAVNFRAFDELELVIPPQAQTLALVGVNGAGKTSILDGLAIALSRLEARIRASHGRGRELREDDLRTGARLQSLEVEICWQGKNVAWQLEKARWPSSTPHGSSFEALTELAEDIRARLAQNDTSSVPLVVFYPVNRSVIDIPLRIRQAHVFDQRAAYEDALTGAGADFRRFFEWFRDREDYERECRDQDSSYVDRQLEAVRQAVAALVPGMTRLRVTRQPLRMLVDKGGREFAVNQLSDGEKCLLAMVGDLARRLALANPGLANPLRGEGLVLIDEIELHLHPAWQRNIVPALERTFPGCQFLLTTHSPAVLGHLAPDCVFLLTHEPGRPLQNLTTLGQDANRLLEEVFGVPPRPQEFEQALQDLFAAIEANQLASAKEKTRDLRAILADREPELSRAEALIRRKEILGR